MMMTPTLLLVGLLAITGLQERREGPAPDTTSVAGDWTLSLHGDHVRPTGLQLKQDGKAISGQWLTMGRSVEVDGEYVDRLLTLRLALPAAHGAQPDAGAAVTVSATMKDDGTLEGEMRNGNRPIKITMERFKPPKLAR